MSNTADKIEGTEENWDERILGADEKYAIASNENDDEISESLGLKMISIRLEQSLIEDYKAIAALHGLGYQTLMRQQLKRFADYEKKNLLREAAAKRIAELKAEQNGEQHAQNNKQQKAA